MNPNEGNGGAIEVIAKVKQSLYELGAKAVRSLGRVFRMQASFVHPTYVSPEDFLST